MKKVLILANSSSGLYGFRNELVTELLKKYEVYVSLPDETNNKELAEEGCKVIHTPINRRGVNPTEDLKLYFAYRKLLKTIKPDVVLTYTIKPNVYGGFACKVGKVPCIANITGLGTALQNGGILAFVTKTMYKVGLKGANAIFVQNSANKEFFEKNKLTKKELRLLPGSGVNPQRFSVLEWPGEKNEFVFISRVMKDKGIEEYLQCAENIRKEYPDTVFHILGYCDEKGYEERLKALNEAGTIVYHGNVKDVRQYLKDYKCIIHPSYHEGMSNVCLEAAASGRAVITTDVPGCRETVVDGVSGYSVKVKDADALTDAVRRFIALPESEKKAMGAAGRKHIEENFDRQIIVDAYMEQIGANI